MACLAKSATIASTALSIPLFKSIGFAPAATFFNPSFTIACAKTVAVVVPSPAKSLVLEATSFTICAPIFSSGSNNSISFATVTPSLVTTGAPKDLLIITFLPLGPSVTFTAFANASTPLFRPSRASISNLISFAIMKILYKIFKSQSSNSKFQKRNIFDFTRNIFGFCFFNFWILQLYNCKYVAFAHH